MGGLDQTFAEGGHNFLRWYAGNDKARGMWESYLDSLPKMGDNFDPTPDFFSDEEIEALELPLSVRLAKEKRTQVAELAEREGLSFDELQFTAWIVSSRAFIINIDVGGEGPTKAGPGGGSDSVAVRRKSLRVLIPYLDMINHSSDNATPNCISSTPTRMRPGLLSAQRDQSRLGKRSRSLTALVSRVVSSC